MKLCKLARKSRIILALDFMSESLKRNFELLMDYMAGVKIGIPYILDHGIDGLKKLRRDDVYILADFKLADIPAMMHRVIERVSKYIDGVIVHAFIGSEAIKKLKERADDLGIDLFLVVAMTHKGAEEFINKNFNRFIKMANELASGVVAPATYPEYIREARRYLRDKIILSPGVGTQGAEFGVALMSGADFEIVGRSITLSPDPRKMVQYIREKHIIALKNYSPQTSL